MIADYYVLFACDKDEDIDAFLEDMVAHNMPDCKKSLSNPLHLIILINVKLSRYVIIQVNLADSNP